MTPLDQIRAATLAGDRAEQRRLLWGEAEAIREYLYGFRLTGASEESMKGYVNDALPRFLRTLERMPMESGLRVLELGANPYLFSMLLKRFHDFELTHTNYFGKNIYEIHEGGGSQSLVGPDEEHVFEYQNLNIEVQPGPYCGGGFDVIVFGEILEHLVIDPLQVFGRLLESLKPGGTLVLTTPNAVRLINVANMLVGSNIFDRYHPVNGIYGRHNREFTAEEVDRLLRENGFDVVAVETEDRYNYDFITMSKDNYEAPGVLPFTRTSLVQKLESIGADMRNRGDNIYAVAVRPA